MSILQSFYYAFVCIVLTLGIQPTNYLGLKKVQDVKQDDNLLHFFCRLSNIKSHSKDTISWKKSILLTTTKDTLCVLAKFDHSESIRVKLNNTPYILYPEKIQAIAIEDQVFISSEFEENEQLFFEYFELLSEGKYYLLKKQGTYYYKKNKGPALKLKQNKKSLLKIFQGHENKISNFIKSNKINIKNEKDIIMVFNFVNHPTDMDNN